MLSAFVIHNVGGDTWNPIPSASSPHRILDSDLVVVVVLLMVLVVLLLLVMVAVEVIRGGGCRCWERWWWLWRGIRFF